MLGSEAVFDADRRDTEVAHEALQQRVGQPAGTQRPAAAVDVQQHRDRVGRVDDAQLERTTGPGDRDRPRVR
jgi:hypothetical protein